MDACKKIHQTEARSKSAWKALEQVGSFIHSLWESWQYDPSLHVFVQSQQQKQ